MNDVNVTIIGGGIVGCAVAEACSGLGLTVVLLEQETDVARGTTSRNSGVSHGGMYYPEGSLKARFCVQGRRLLKDFCTKEKVSYKECGKLIVATSEKEIPVLDYLFERGQRNGVEDLEILDATEIAHRESGIHAVAALWSPRTAIVDAEGATRAFARKAQNSGAEIMTSARLDFLKKSTNGWKVGIEPSGPERSEGWIHKSDFVVNAAGLFADRVASMAGFNIGQRQWCQTPVKGNYFLIDPEHSGRVGCLVYPVPPADHSSLGVHLCLDLAGQLRLGPDVEIEPGLTAKQLSYKVDDNRMKDFYHGAVGFLPWLKAEDLSADMSGYRPKLAVSGFKDFVVHLEDRMVNLIGIDSPGLTSATALAQYVAQMIVNPASDKIETETPEC